MITRVNKKKLKKTKSLRDLLVLGTSNSRHSGTSDGMADAQTLDDLEKLLKTKGDLLRFINGETREIIAKAKISDLERQRKTLEHKLQEVQELKLRIQEKKLGEGVSQEDVRSWTEQTKANNISPIEDAIAELETVILKLQKDMYSVKRRT